MTKFFKILIINLLITSSIYGQVPERKSSPPPPPPPAPEPVKEEMIFISIPDMPIFPGCELVKNKEEREACTDRKLHEFLIRNIKYPEAAIRKGITGKVHAKFIIDKDGKIIDEEIEKGIGGNCDEEVLRVIRLFNEGPHKFSPPRSRGRAVKVQKKVVIHFTTEMLIKSKN